MNILKNKNNNNQPKVCHLYYSRVITSAILNREAQALKDKGFEVDIIGLRNSPRGKIFQRFEGLNLYCIQPRPSNETTTTYFFNLTLFMIKSLVLLSYLTIKRRYNIIHVTSPPDIIVFAAIVPRLLGAKIILDIHDICPELYMRKLNVSDDQKIIKILKFFEKISCRFAHHVITVTDLWRETLIKRSVAPDECSVLLNVPDNDVFKPVATNNRRTSNGCNLFYHGSFEEHFGVDILLKAMPTIKKYIPNVVLNIYGAGRLEEEFKDLTKKLDIIECVRFHQGVPFYELPEILKIADIGVVPTKNSIFSDEALSMKALEYISLGIPIVISKTKVHNYYYNSSMVKFFEPNNEQELAKSVIFLYENEEERKNLIRNSRSFIQKFGWQEQKKVYYQIVDRLIDNRVEA